MSNRTGILQGRLGNMQTRKAFNHRGMAYACALRQERVSGKQLHSDSQVQ